MTNLRIDVADRSAALELVERLTGVRAWVVRGGQEGWSVAVDPAGDSDRATASVLNTLQDWVVDGGSDCVLHRDGRAYPLRATAASG